MNKRHLTLQLLGLLLSIGMVVAQNRTGLTTRTIHSKQASQEENYKNLRFTLGGGYAYWLGKELKNGNSVFDDLSKGLRHGYNLDVEAQYFLAENVGIGLNGNFVKHSSSESPTISIPTSTGYHDFRVGETDNYFYVGPSCVFRSEIGKWGFYGNIGLGVIFLEAVGSVEDSSKREEIRLKYTTLGLYSAVAAEYRLSHYLGTGLKLALTGGTVKQEGLEERMSASNLQLTGFLSFRTK